MTLKEIEQKLDLAVIESERGVFDEADRLATEVLRSLDEVFTAERNNANVLSLRAEALRVVAFVTVRHGHGAQAQPHAEEALSLAREAHDRACEARCLNTMGIIFTDYGDYQKSLEYYQQALDLNQEIGVHGEVVRNLCNLGNASGNLSESERAAGYFTRALTLCQEHEPNELTAITLQGFGSMYLNLCDYDKALEYFIQALRINEQLGMLNERSSNYAAIATTYQGMGDHHKSLEYFSQALSISEEQGSTKNMLYQRTGIGNAYWYLGEYAKALESFEQTLTLTIDWGYKEAIATSYGNIGIVYASVEFDGYDPAKAEEYFLKSMSFFESTGNKIQRMEGHRVLAELYEQQNRWQEFAEQLRKYYEITREVQSEETRKRLSAYEHERQMAARDKQLDIERAHARATESVLHKVLPPTVANRLIRGEKVADYFQHISIMFADIVGFTPIASRMPARAVLAFLNYVFGEFDTIMEKHGCQKIKTMGDGYMAVAGAPVPCDDHAERILRAALELQDDIRLSDEIRNTIPRDCIFHLRIGLHTGSAFAGIIGENGFVYDVYSDAVNIAARMESQGEPGRIHCSEEFAYHVQNRISAETSDLASVKFIEREEIEIKGKGKMRTYFLEKQP